MLLLEEDLREFKRLYFQHFGVYLTDAQTLDKASRLLRLVKVVAKATVEKENEIK